VVIGHLTGFLTVLKGQPLAYNRDLQWDKRLVFGAVDDSAAALEVLTRFLRHVRIRREGAARLLASDALCATDLAEWLVQRGVAFADAHGLVGRLVAAAERQGKRLGDLTAAERRRISPALAEVPQALFDPRRSVWRKRSLGSTHPRQVAAAIARWRRRLH
jgi:argininosuccinate lyase